MHSPHPDPDPNPSPKLDLIPTTLRYVCGLREVLRALKLNKAKALIVSHNIEQIGAEDGLDSLLAQLVQV